MHSCLVRLFLHCRVVVAAYPVSRKADQTHCCINTQPMWQDEVGRHCQPQERCRQLACCRRHDSSFWQTVLISVAHLTESVLCDTYPSNLHTVTLLFVNVQGPGVAVMTASLCQSKCDAITDMLTCIVHVWLQVAYESGVSSSPVDADSSTFLIGLIRLRFATTCSLNCPSWTGF